MVTFSVRQCFACLVAALFGNSDNTASRPNAFRLADVLHHVRDCTDFFREALHPFFGERDAAVSGFLSRNSIVILKFHKSRSYNNLNPQTLQNILVFRKNLNPKQRKSPNLKPTSYFF